jgi:hypothetical protein
MRYRTGQNNNHNHNNYDYLKPTLKFSDTHTYTHIHISIIHTNQNECGILCRERRIAICNQVKAINYKINKNMIINKEKNISTPYFKATYALQKIETPKL